MAVIVVAAVGVSLMRHFVFTANAKTPSATKTASVERGAELFKKNCSSCHDTNSTDPEPPPGMKGLFERGKLPVSGKPVNAANIRDQIRTPYKNMPSFKGLSDDKVDALIAYLKTR